MENMKTWINLTLFTLFVNLLISCGGGSESSSITPPVLTPIPISNSDKVDLELNFNKGTDGWVAGFADYPVGDDLTYELSSGYEQLPAPLQTKFGFSVTGTNRSDNLFMFIKKGFSGFSPNTTYQIKFIITFATNAQSDCNGIGGSPGKAVVIKAGAANTEPLSIITTKNKYRMNIDVGIQKNDGKNAVIIGDFANTQVCDPVNAFYELKTLNSDLQELIKSVTVSTDSSGVIWFIFATDSGFESTTKIYYINGSITATNI